MSMRKFATLLVALVAFLGTLSAQLPSVQLKNINGETVNTAEISNDGKPIIISFFATWCKPCIRELKAIHELYPDWQDETGVRIIIVSIDQAQDVLKVKPFVDGYGWEYEVLLDPNGEFKRAMNVQTIPHIFVLDGNGNVQWQHVGYTDGGEEEVRKHL